MIELARTLVVEYARQFFMVENSSLKTGDITRIARPFYQGAPWHVGMTSAASNERSKLGLPETRRPAARTTAALDVNQLTIHIVASH